MWGCEICTFAIVLVVLYALYSYLLSVLGRQQVSASSRYIFITGCDTGFGHLAAKRFDAKGCHVIAGCLTEKGEEELRKACSSRLKTVHLNVTKHDSVIKAAEFVKELLPPKTGLWGIINNAGVLCPMIDAEILPLSFYSDAFAVNCLGQVDVTKTLLPLMSPQDGGRIVNVSSMCGRTAVQQLAPYAISKYGVEAFSDSIRRELHKFNISVHLIEPGGHSTHVTRSQKHQMEEAWRLASPEVQEKYGGTPYLNKRLATSNGDGAGNPENVVDAFEHALFSRYPRPRYVIGWDAKLFVIIQLLPEWIGDALIRRMFLS